MNNTPCRKPSGPYLIESAPKLKQVPSRQSSPRNRPAHLVAAVDLFCSRGRLSGRVAPSARCRGDLSWIWKIGGSTVQEIKCSCKNEFQDKHYGKLMRTVTPVNKSRDAKTKVVQTVRCTVCAKEHPAPVGYAS